MLAFILSLLGVDPLGKLLGSLGDAYKAKLGAANDADRIAAEVAIAQIKADIENQRNAAAIVQSGMQHKLFWVAWGMAALPLAAWFGWGCLDTLMNGALPDVAELPPQLKQYADVVWGNIFYAGGAVAGVTGAASIIGKAIANRR